jgi:hypothetical protein
MTGKVGSSNDYEGVQWVAAAQREHFFSGQNHSPCPNMSSTSVI